MPLDVCPGAQHLLQRPSDRLRSYDLFDLDHPRAMQALASRCVREQAAKPGSGCRCDQGARRVHLALREMAEVEHERELERAVGELARLLEPDSSRAEADDENELRGRDCLERDEDLSCPCCGELRPLVNCRSGHSACELCRLRMPGETA